MASIEEDNKLECISNVNKDQERYFLTVYKKHECILNNKNETFENKIESLIEVWKSVGELNLGQFDIRHVIQIMDWAKLHALNIVLTAQWTAFKDTRQEQLLQEIEKAQNELLKLNSAFATRCKKLADVVRNPWEDPILMNLMKTKDAEIGPEEIEFFCVETAYLVSVRLKKLCESHCEDLALNLVTAFMNCNRLSKIQNFSLNATDTQMWFIFDIHIALLYKFQEKQKIVVLLKELTFTEGLQLVRRFAKKRVKISKIWKNCNRVAILATQMYISQAVVKYTDELKEILGSYIEMYISLCNDESLVQDFPSSIRRISNLADAAGLYIFCDVIQRKAGSTLKPFIIEMYIRALTTDMNELERQKDASELLKVEMITSRLADAFVSLAEFLDEHVKVARECILTAFSLSPTKERLTKIEDLARRSGFQVLDTGQEWKCKLHPPVLPSDDVAWICPECGDWMCKPQLNAPIKINMALNEALQNSVLGISEALCDDLVVCLSNPRYQVLSWFLPWDDLHRLCIMYLQDPQTTKNIVTELKFVDIDYSIFKGIKREPLDELAGIERGYEQYLDHDFVSDEESNMSSEDGTSQSSRSHSIVSDGISEIPFFPVLPPPKSDPNTLKSLRMFRPNLKRSKEKDCNEATVEKIFKSDPYKNTIEQTQSILSNSKDPPKVTDRNQLSNFLNGFSPTKVSENPQFASVGLNNSNPDSKNVEIATLPLLGGQVAKKETALIQLNQKHRSYLGPKMKTYLQKSKDQPINQALKPFNQSKVNGMLSVKKTLMIKLLTKHLVKHSKENNNHNARLKNTQAESQNLTNSLNLIEDLQRNQIDTERKFLKNAQPDFVNVTNSSLNLIGDIQRNQMNIQRKMMKTQNLTDTSWNLNEVVKKNRLPDCLKYTQKQPQNLKNPSNLINCLQSNQTLAQEEFLNTLTKPLNLTNSLNAIENLQRNQVAIKFLKNTQTEPQNSTNSLSNLNKGHQRNQMNTQRKFLDDSSQSFHQILKMAETLDVPLKMPEMKAPSMPPKPTLTTVNAFKPKPIGNRSLIIQVPLSQLQCDNPFLKDFLIQHPSIQNHLQKNPSSINKNLEHLLLKQNLQQKQLITENLELKKLQNSCSNLHKALKHCPSSDKHRLLIHSPYPSSNPQTKISETSKSSPTPLYRTFQPQTPLLKAFPRVTNPDKVNSTLVNPEPKVDLFQETMTNQKIPVESFIANQPQSTCQDVASQKVHNANKVISNQIQVPQIPPKAVTQEKKLPQADNTVPPNKITANSGKMSVTSQNLVSQNAAIQAQVCPASQKLNPGYLEHKSKSNQTYTATEISTIASQDQLPLNSIFKQNVGPCKKKTHQPNSDQLQEKTQITENTALNINSQVMTKDCQLKPSLNNNEESEYRQKTFSTFLTALVKNEGNVDKNRLNKLCKMNKCNNNLNNGHQVQIKLNKLHTNNLPKGQLTEEITKDLNKISVGNEMETDALLQNNNNNLYYLNKTEVDKCDLSEGIPKKFNLTEDIETCLKNCTKKLNLVIKDCLRKPVGDDKLKVCKNVNSNSISDVQEHSNIKHLPTKTKELKIALFRLFSDEENFGKPMLKKEDNLGIKLKCDRGRNPHKNSRRRRSIDKSENDKNVKAPHIVQNHKLSPLQDVNLRVNATVNNKCCDLSKPNILEASKGPALASSDNSIVKKNYARSVLANVPGLNNFEMIRPQNVDQIVNVVQISGGRTTETVPIPNSQTSTQVTPHIQRIGQPRVGEQKPIETSAATSTIPQITTTSSRTTSSQPSTLINILSQQIIRPVTTQSVPSGQRRAPFINILSQQIIRPPTNTTKSSNSSSSGNSANNNSNTAGQETNQVKAATTGESTVIPPANNIKNTNIMVKTTNTATVGQGSTILQFICKSTLPKFQQAFGKAVYQNAEVTVQTTNTVETTTTSIADAKKTVTKTVPVNVQPIQGSVIYSRQVPVGPTISLIPPGGTTRQVFRIATSNPEQLSLVKDSVIHSKMSALLAAALQGRPKNADGDVQLNCDEGKKVTLARPTLVQNARIVKPVQLQIPTNVVKSPQGNLSSTTLEQLREFDMVYKQIKERSSTITPSESVTTEQTQEITQQRISVTYVNQLQKYTQLSPVVVVSSYSNLQPVASPALSVTSQGSSSPCVTPASTPTLPKVTSKSSKGKSLKNSPNNIATKSSPIPKPQQKPQEDEHTTQRIFDILAEYAEQLRNSPDLNNKPAPRRRSNPPTNPNHSSKRKKSSSSSKKIGQSSSNSLDIDTDDMTVGSEDSSGGGMVQLSVTDDEQSQAATTNPIEANDNSSSSGSRPLILTESNVANQSRNLIITDTSVGEALKMPNTAVIVPGSYIMPVSMVKAGGQQIAVVSGGNKILATVPARSGQNMLLFQSFTNQNRKGAISAVKYSTIQPLSGISSQSLAGVSAQPPVILPSNSVATAVALGHPLTLQKIGDERENNEVLLTISHQKGGSKVVTTTTSDIVQPDSSTSIASSDVNTKMEESTSKKGTSNDKIYQSYQKSVITNSVGTSVIATTSSTSIKAEDDNGAPTILNMSMGSSNKMKETKPNERMQSVLVTACTSNGPMLSHTTPRYRKPTDTERINNNDIPNKEQFLHNGEKSHNNEQKSIKGSSAYYSKVKKVSMESQKIECEMQKQAAIERELRLQKSLSEECEDLGVDEPSTSDLFPEADLLFDSNHSPSFEQSSQEVIKRAPQGNEKEDAKEDGINLFSDDENSSSLRSDLFEYVEYQSADNVLDYQTMQLMNGNRTGTDSGSSGCEDNTLHPKCCNMAAVTLNSPISPEVYQENTLSKYKFKYSNRKKCEKVLKQNDISGEVVSSSEDVELGEINCEDGNFQVVHVAITKADLVKDEETCELHCHDDVDSPSGRGARRSVRKMCSCCNGSRDGHVAKKRPHSSRPHTPATPHKKSFLKKR